VRMHEAVEVVAQRSHINFVHKLCLRARCLNCVYMQSRVQESGEGADSISW
jgi:hypothetical protein